MLLRSLQLTKVPTIWYQRISVCSLELANPLDTNVAKVACTIKGMKVLTIWHPRMTQPQQVTVSKKLKNIHQSLELKPLRVPKLMYINKSPLTCLSRYELWQLTDMWEWRSYMQIDTWWQTLFPRLAGKVLKFACGCDRCLSSRVWTGLGATDLTSRFTER